MLLSIQDLKVGFRMGKVGGQMQRQLAVKGVSFDIPENSTVALVGESGSGKSVTAMSILNLLPDNAEREGRILFQGRDLLRTSQRELQSIRGREIACVFQDPMSSLNPVFTVATQIMEPLIKHLGLSKKQALVRAEELLNEVGIPDPKRRLHTYPHEMSGGQQQRVMIAVALACKPKLLIADEPTTALDVTIQRQVMELLAKLKDSHKMSLLFISHDLGVVGEVSDQVVVMRHGEIREKAPVAEIFHSPQDPYTRALLACRPSLTENPGRLMVIDDHIAAEAGQARQAREHSVKDPNAPVVLEVRNLNKSFFFKTGLFGTKEFKAVKNVNFKLRKGYTLGVVGESGSGKTTMGLTLLRLHEPTSGEVLFEGKDLLKMSGNDWQKMRRRIQVVFQNPYASLNPRFTIAQALLEPMEIHGIGANHADRLARATALLHKVGLTEAALSKYPHEFSGGQRQRIAIARCLTLNPEVLVLDESVSALDVSVQAQVLNLLKDLQDEFGLSYIFISHDLAVVKFISDEVLVMQHGDVVEQASSEEILAAPKQEYTRRLLGAVPKGYTGAAPAH
ncbi:ABC transporter ATP-binding protein [Roseateles sp. BYS180W]|uniref:ABC transporter ATP-binding protein n=1 Tax=Roseateles rivi TaxID=3299028 RepID=A0ABW7FUH0_9BURK